MIDKEKWMWIGIAILLVFVIGMFFQKNYGLFAGGGYCLTESSTLAFARENIYSGVQLAQSFKPEITGTLSDIRLRIDKSSYGTPADLLIEIKEQLDGTSLWSYTVPASQIGTENDWIVGTADTNLELINGNIYYIVVSSTSQQNEAYGWTYYAGTDVSYAEGTAWQKTSTGNWQETATRDYWFVVDVCGEPDLTCSFQNGHICAITEICPVSWMTATDTTRCCPLSCQPATCLPGEILKYNCTDGTQVSWCSCVNTEWSCVFSPETQCPTCTDTCSSLGKTCGTQTICGSSINCGTCQTGKTCSSGQCISQPECQGIKIGNFCLAWWMLILLLILLYFMFRKKGR